MCSNNNYNTFYETVIPCCFAPKSTLPTMTWDTASTLIIFIPMCWIKVTSVEY